MFNKNDLKKIKIVIYIIGEMDLASIGTYYLPKSMGKI